MAEIRADAVLTTTGDVLPADAVLVGVGVTPMTALADEAGLTVDDGIVTDAALRTSHPDVFAAGDVANAFHPRYGRHLRSEHWANALNSGPAAARAMLGQDVTYDRVPYFFSDQYDLGMEYTGDIGPSGYDQVDFRRPADSQLIVFWLYEQRVQAGMYINIWDVADDIELLIQFGRPVNADDLADPDIPLPSLLTRPAGLLSRNR